MDMYLLKKLLNLKSDDGFKMNEVLVSLWYIMGLWPLVYGMLLLPSGRRYIEFGFLAFSAQFKLFSDMILVSAAQIAMFLSGLS